MTHPMRDDLQSLPEPRTDLIPGETPEEKLRWLKRRCYANRRNALACVKLGGSGHMGGAMSCAEILGALYFWCARHDPSDPAWEDRDRIILSKGHASPMLYAVLASAGYFPERELPTFRQLNSRLQGHPEYGTPGVEVPTGSLGQGFSSGLGIALGLRYQHKDPTVWAVIGDGELQEGQCWEVILAAGAKRVGNFVAVLDYNGIQQDGFTRDILPYGRVEEKFRAFDWETVSVNGHSIDELIPALLWAKSVETGPAVVIAKTVKGFGVSYMENEPKWHGTRPPSDELYERALDDLRRGEERIG